MRLSRTFLALAAGLAGNASAANITVDGDRTITSLSEMTGNNFALGNGATLVIDLQNALGAPIDGTFSGAFQDGSYDGTGALNPGLDRTGTLVKAGGGTLQYNGFSNLGYLGNRSFDGGLLSPLPTDLRPLVAGGTSNAGAQQGFGGIVIIQQGQLQVSGYINQWADYGPFNAAFGVGGVMLGAAATVVDAGGKISFRNTALNLPGAAANLDDTEHNNPATPLVGRLNYLNNLRASTASRVETGADDTHILVLHSDMDAVGLPFAESTLGVLEGKGRVYKTGASDLRVTNSSTFSGEFVANGGRLILAAGSGDTLWSAKSVNLASGGQGTNVGFDVGDSLHWKPSYAPGNAGPTTLVVQGAQRLRNFQSLYADGGFTSLLLPGTGAGNFVELASAGDILTVDHEAGYDGYFTGSVVGAADAVTGVRGQALGTLVKTGEGALALFSVGNNMSRLEIRAGRVVSNVQSLGSGEVVLSGTGSLSIVQNDAGALRAVIRSDSTATTTSLVFRPTDSIQYRGADGADLGNADEGLADIVVAQPFFYGQVIVEDGNDIAFSAGNNNAFENASAIILNEGASGRETSIRFNDTNQLVRNLQGSASSRIYLGRGDITLVNAASTTYSGGISGVGNLIKSGANTFTLAGSNNYFGATVVTGGSLVASSASGIGNTSGLVVDADAVFTATSEQAIGGLFGLAGAKVTVSGALTVGVPDDLRDRLVSELDSLPGTVPAVSAAYYLATESAGVLPGFGFSPATTLGYLVRQYGLVAAGATEAEVAAYLDADGSGSTTLDDLSAGDIEANRDLLAFSGAMTVGGALTKTGAERLTLLGTVTFTGADRRVIVEQGTLEVALATLGSASAIEVGADGAIELGVSADSTLGLALSGTGTFRKTGAGALRVDRGAGAPAFDGLYDVLGGDLTVAFRPSALAGVAREGSVATAAGTSFTAEVATDLSWAGEVFGSGDFIKTGAGSLTMTSEAVSPLFTTGTVRVVGGALTAAATPEADLAIAAGAAFTAALLQDDFFDGVLSGAGTFAKTGAFDLRMETVATFTGDVEVTEGSLSLGAAGVLATAGSISLAAGTTLNVLDGLAQSLNNVSAEDGTASVVAEVAGTELTLDVLAGDELDFPAQILGSPVILKTGAGKLSFIRDVGADNVIQAIDIQGGELEASLSGLGGATLNVGALGTLRFFADDGVTDTYAAGFTVTGDGKVAKSGAGTVDLAAADLSTISADFDISGGTLVLSRAALGARLPAATVAEGATLAFETDADITLDADGITGGGNLELRGAFGIDLTLGDAGSPGYTGSTVLADGVTVRLASPTGSAALGGLSAEAGTTLDTSLLGDLELTLDGDTAFDGALVGSADLVLAGEGALDFTDGDTGGDLAGYLGSITLDGSSAILSTGNTKDLALSNSARVVLTGAASQAYAAGLSGDGTGIVALGAAATLDLVANPLTSLDDGFVAKVELLAGSTLTMGLSGISLDKVVDLSLSGGTLELGLTEATGTLDLAAPLAGATGGDLDIATALGSARVDITGSLAGNLTLGDKVTLGGTPTVVGTLTVETGARIAPGFSPGTVTTTDFVNAGTLVMELGSSSNDQILFSGTADLNNGGTGRLELALYGAGNLFGRRQVLLADTASPGAGSFIGAAPRFATVVSTDASPLRVLLVYPSQLQAGLDGILGNADDAADPLGFLATPGQVAAYVVRSGADYDATLAGSPYLAAIKSRAQVDLTPVAGGSSSSLAPTFNSYGARLAILGDTALIAAVDNLRPRGHAALLSGAAAGFRSHADTLQRRLEQRRFDGADMSVKTADWFVDATHGQLDLDNSHEARNTGATAGTIRPMGVDGYWAVSLGVENLKADGGATSYKGNGFRLGAAAGVMNAARTLSLDAGLSYGSLSGDLTRPSLVGGNNVTDPKAETLGLWVRASAATSVGGLAVTPFISLEHAKTSLDATRETGAADPLGDSLAVRDADHTQTAARAGLGLHHSWVSDGGDWRYRLGLEVAYALQLDGDEATLVSNHAQLGGTDVSSTFGVLPGDGFSVAPTFTFGTSPDSTFTLGLRLEQGSEGEATSLQLGYRRKF